MKLLTRVMAADGISKTNACWDESSRVLTPELRATALRTHTPIMSATNHLYSLSELLCVLYNWRILWVDNRAFNLTQLTRCCSTQSLIKNFTDSVLDATLLDFNRRRPDVDARTLGESSTVWTCYTRRFFPTCRGCFFPLTGWFFPRGDFFPGDFFRGDISRVIFLGGFFLNSSPVSLSSLQRWSTLVCFQQPMR